MDSRKVHCVGDCDFSRYYLAQAGNGFSDINVFRGTPYQRGYGIGSVFKRFGIPLAKFLGRHLLNTGLSVGAEIAATNSINKDNIRNRLRQGIKSAAKEGLNHLSNFIDQQGEGRKRVYKKRRQPRKVTRKVTKRRATKIVKRRKRDIFS